MLQEIAAAHETAMLRSRSPVEGVSDGGLRAPCDGGSSETDSLEVCSMAVRYAVFQPSEADTVDLVENLEVATSPANARVRECVTIWSRA